jgi:hypothetical protein
MWRGADALGGYDYWPTARTVSTTMQFDHVAHQVQDIAHAVDWWREIIPGTKVLYQDDSWAMIEAGGVKIAFVLPDQHPDHMAWRVSNAELEELADRFDLAIHSHRDGSRSFYLEAPGRQPIEIVAYPETSE